MIVTMFVNIYSLAHIGITFGFHIFGGFPPVSSYAINLLHVFIKSTYDFEKKKRTKLFQNFSQKYLVLLNPTILKYKVFTAPSIANIFFIGQVD